MRRYLLDTGTAGCFIDRRRGVFFDDILRVAGALGTTTLTLDDYKKHGRYSGLRLSATWSKPSTVRRCRPRRFAGMRFSHRLCGMTMMLLNQRSLTEVMMSLSIPEGAWLPIDEAIFANMKLPALAQIRSLSGCGLADALEILSDRYRKLRAEWPQRFNCSDQTYWEGFYS